MDRVEWLGWLSSAILVATMAKQVSKQWHERSTAGVSIWLYIGQFAAEIGFVAYSLLIESWVFLVTNLALLLLNVAGLFLVLKRRRASHLEKGETDAKIRVLRA